MKFKLQSIEEDYLNTGIPQPTHTTEFNAETLPDILLNIENFLRGSGFYLKNLDWELPSECTTE